MQKQKKLKKQIKRIARNKNYHGLIGIELDLDSKNIKKYVNQYKESGFDDSELWNLDLTLGRFLLPRLKRFKEIIQTSNLKGYPPICESFEEWLSILDEIIWMFETHIADDYQEDKDLAKMLEERMNKAKELFGKYWTYFWD